MDRMTKLVAGRLKAQAAAGPHPDPELLSAFAENTLSEAERGPLLQHLGVCSDCREVLYLASTDSPAMQKVLVPQPRPFTFRRWIFAWGSLAAAGVVVAIFFTANRLEYRNQSSARMVTNAPLPTPASQAAAMKSSAGANPNETKLAADKAPQELDRLQAAHDRAQRDFGTSKAAAALQKRESATQPEAKHMTAKPQANLDFDQSGQVRVFAPKNPVPQNADQIAAVPGAGSRIENLPVEGRNVGAPAVSITTSATPAVSPSAIGGMVAGKGAAGAAYSRTDRLAGRSGPGGNVGGTIIDSSGAVVANAKVTLIGPSGQKSAVSDSEGRFSFATVDPGAYSLKAEANGFKATEIQQVAVLDDKRAALNVRLEAGTASEVVEVTGAANAIPETRALAVDATGASSGYIAQQASQDFGVVGANAANAQLKSARAKVRPPLQWTVSSDGAVESSGNGGKTWQPASVPGGATFRALSAVDGNIWAGGKAGALYHSLDSGKSWVRCEPAVGDKKLSQDVVRVDFADPLNGTVMTANGEVWSTSDGGKTWLLK